MMRIFGPLAVCALVVACSSEVPAADCGGTARLVDGVCRPLCSVTEDCLGRESCVDGVCVPGAGAADASTLAEDAHLAAPDADARRDAEPMGADAGRARDADEQPRDAEEAEPDATAPDARPPRDASPVPHPDLRVATSAAPASPMLVDERFALAVTVENIGDLPSGANTLALYVNPPGDRTVTGNSVRIGEATVNSVAVGATAVATVTGLLPASTPPGARTLIVVVDAANTVVELDETNNVGLVGDVDVTTVALEPVTVDFGPVVAPCGETSRSVQIVNRSTSFSVNITRIELGSMTDAFEPRPPMTPTMLGPNMVMSFAVLFHPTATGPAQSSLLVRHNQPGSPLSTTLLGSGVSGSVVDSFPASQRTRRADVVFVIDPNLDANARSDLMAQTGAILGDLSQRQISYRIGVRQAGALAGSSRGFVGVPAFITPTSPDAAAELANRIDSTHSVVPLANNGLAEIDATLAAANPGLLEDAWLEVIAVSSSEDTSNVTVSAVAGRVIGEKPVEGVAAVSAIIPLMCPGGPPDAVRYSGLVTATGGRAASVCGRAWSGVLTNIGGLSFGTPFAYTLSGAPDVSTLQVTVGGMALGEDQFSYDPGANRVLVRADALPAPNVDLAIAYVPVCP